MTNEEIQKVDGVEYRSIAGEDCVMCAGEHDIFLCRKLPSCIASLNRIIWVLKPVEE